MDPSRFDTLARSLTDARSRRGALTVLLGSTLGLLGLTDTTAKKGKNKKKKNRDPSSPPPPPTDPTAPPPRDCNPSCTGGQTCKGGICACPRGKESCGGGCVGVCVGGAIRNPVTCECCLPTDSVCTIPPTREPCCSNGCGMGGFCRAISAGDPCTFSQQCASGACVSGACS